AYDAESRTYTIQPGTETGAIQQIISTASAGSVIYFAEGKHVLTRTIEIERGDITLQGAGRDKTTLLFDFEGKSGYGIHVEGVYNGWTAELSADAHKGDSVITLKSAAGLKAG